VIPKKCFFTIGVGVHKEKLASFELALRSAGLPAALCAVAICPLLAAIICFFVSSLGP